MTKIAQIYTKKSKDHQRYNKSTVRKDPTQLVHIKCKKESSPTYSLSLELLMHLFHARISYAVWGPAVYVVTKLSVIHQKNANVSHGAQIYELSDLIIHEPLPDQSEEHPLENSCNANQSI